MGRPDGIVLPFLVAFTLAFPGRRYGILFLQGSLPFDPLVFQPQRLAWIFGTRGAADLGPLRILRAYCDRWGSCEANRAGREKTKRTRTRRSVDQCISRDLCICLL